STRCAPGLTALRVLHGPFALWYSRPDAYVLKYTHQYFGNLIVRFLHCLHRLKPFFIGFLYPMTLQFEQPRPFRRDKLYAIANHCDPRIASISNDNLGRRSPARGHGSRRIDRLRVRRLSQSAGRADTGLCDRNRRGVGVSDPALPRTACTVLAFPAPAAP